MVYILSLKKNGQAWRWASMGLEMKPSYYDPIYLGCNVYGRLNLVLIYCKGIGKDLDSLTPMKYIYGNLIEINKISLITLAFSLKLIYNK